MKRVYPGGGPSVVLVFFGLVGCGPKGGEVDSRGSYPTGVVEGSKLGPAPAAVGDGEVIDGVGLRALIDRLDRLEPGDVGALRSFFDPLSGEG